MQNETTNEALAELSRAFSRDLRNLPDVPSANVLWFLTRTTAAKFPSDWEIGKRLQRENPGTIPAKTECEMAAGLWFRIATALRTPPPASAGQAKALAEELTDAVVEITEAAILCLDADEENNAQMAAFERAILPTLTVLRSPPPAPTAPAEAGEGTFQQRVQPWLLACFGEMIAGDREERNHRFLEEALELVQACGCSASEAHQLVDYVYGRPVGELHQEIGGVMVTLAALCLAHDADMHAAGWVELNRIWGKVDQIRAKQAAKPKHSPLPAALRTPPPAPPSADTVERVAETIYEIDREGWLEKHPDDSFLTWQDTALGAFKDQWRAKAKRILAAMPPVSEAPTERERVLVEAVRPLVFDTGFAEHYGDEWVRPPKCRVADVIRAREALASIDASTEQPGGWQPIATAPRDGTRFLGFSPEDGVRAVRWKSGYWTRAGASFPETGLTRWRPLAPPVIDASTGEKG